MTEKTKINILKPLIIVILILLLICLGLIGWQTYLTRNQLKQTQTQLESQLQTLQTKLRQTDWTLPEIKYLINLASINLTVNKNISTAIELLQTADKRIAALNSSKLNDLRRALANDISNLQAVPKVDVTGIILRLDAISNQIENLAFIPTAPALTPVKYLQKTTINKLWWQRFYQTTLETLKGIVIIRHHEEGVQPILTEIQQVYLVQNIKLCLEQAKWAVLHEREKVYRASLQKADRLIRFGYSHNLKAAQNILKSLQELQKTNINPTIPKISASIEALPGKVSS